MGEKMRSRKNNMAEEVPDSQDELYGDVIEGEKIPEDSLLSVGKQFPTSNVGDLGVLAYLQALQNLNASNQYFLKKLMETPSSNSGVTAEDIKGIVKTVVSEIMKELGAEAK